MTGARTRSPWLPLLATLAIALLLWQVVQVGIAAHFARSNPVRAVSFEPTQARALLRLARAELATSPQTAASAIERAIVARPADGRAYGLLARLRDHERRDAEARVLYATALRLAPDDDRTRLAYADYLLRQREIDASVVQLAMLLRSRPQDRAAVFDALLQLGVLEQGRKAVLEQLAPDAAMRDEFLLYAAASGRPSRVVDAFFDATAAASGPLARGAYVERLIRERRWQQAWLHWVGGLDPGARARLGNVNDGSFEAPASNAGFGWRIEQAAGVSLALAAAPGAEGTNALVMELYSPPRAVANLRQHLLLTPGRYRLHGRVALDGLESARGLAWTVECEAPGRALAGSSERFTGTTGWREFEAALAVPAEGCPAQTLALGFDPRAPLEPGLSGRATFDALRIVRVGAVPPQGQTSR